MIDSILEEKDGMNMNIVAIMPIKLKNERCPGKNTRLLGGKPLLQHELITLKKTGLCERIYVYCSDESIVSYLPEGVNYMKRPEYLDLPTSNFTQIFESFMAAIESDIYVYAHATAPFITKDTMKECISAVVSGGFDSAFCAVKIQDYLWQDGRPLNFDSRNLPRTQDLKEIYRETSGIYVFTKEAFLKTHSRIGSRPYIKEVSFKEAVDINTPEDFNLAEAFFNIDL